MLQLPPRGGLALDVDPAAVRDTIARVFTHPGYDASLRQSLGDRLIDWIVREIGTLLNAVRGSVNIRWLVIAVAVALVTIVALRVVFLAAVAARRTALPRRGASRRQIPWMVAAQEAAAGRHTEAAHLLHAAVLEALARRHRLILHPARTIGEYERDLRDRSAAALPAFTAFARAYERAIWGGDSIDRQKYDQLERLAAVLVLSEQPRLAA